MSRVTSKLQVTVPKLIAQRYGIRPGDDIRFEESGEVIRVVPENARTRAEGLDIYFRQWIESALPTPYGSFGNGAAMRVSPVALLYRGRSLGEALAASDRVTEITHDHPEGIKGARAVTEAIWLALRGEGPETVRGEITTRYGYDLDRSVEAIRPSHRFDVTCQGTVPTAVICALESTSLEDAVRTAVSLGGDTDTLAAIAGAVGEALHGLDEGLVRTARERYLQDAEDITGALEALCERAAREEPLECRTGRAS